MKKSLKVLFAVLFVFASVKLAAGQECASHKKGEGKKSGVMGLDADYSTVNTKDGVIITIKAKKGGADAKTIQETAKKCIEMCVSGKDRQAAAEDEEVVCPVMGFKMKKSKAFETVRYEGRDYYMCCAGCKENFLKNPKKYTGK